VSTYWQVALERQRDATPTGRQDVSYDFPLLSDRDNARELVRVLLDVDDLSDLDGPGETAIVGGRQVVTLTALLAVEPKTEDA
jgi:hypothetical protein